MGKNLSTFCLCFIAGLVCANSSIAQKVRWLDFASESGFSIHYPDNWFRISATPKNLDIISSRQRVEAVIIPRGAQMINVLESSTVPNDDYLSYFKSTDPDDSVISYATVDIAAANDDSCRKVYVVKSADEVGPKTFYLENHMFCKIGSRLFVLALTQWQADRFNKSAYDLAINMLKSLRVAPRP
ncbi:MAG TPA: hypothetical protein VNF99_17990 [Stellaceae bacterium]|nr:hypothetical protein [Stellaceae bacterium]